MADFAKVNAVYAEYFIKDPPARLCVAVAQIPKEAKIAIEFIVAYPYKHVRSAIFIISFSY